MKRFHFTLIALMMMAALALGGCQTTQAPATQAPEATVEAPETAVQTAESEPTAEPREVITLDLQMAGLDAFADKINTVAHSAVFDAIEEKTGVRMSFTGLSGEQRDVIFASGETTDMITVISTEECNTLITNEMVIPLDDLIASLAPNVSTLYPERLRSSREELSNGTGKVYFLPSNAGDGSVPVRQSVSLYQIRWDYYAELGYPEVNSPGDMLTVLADMQALHPETADGQKIWGISSIVSTMAWRFYASYGYEKIDNSNNQAYINIMTNEIKFMYGVEDSEFWDAMAYFNKAYRLGILDPESLTQTEEDYTTKVTTGRVMSPDLSWLGITAFNTAAEEANAGGNVGIETLPVAGTVINPGLSIAGWGPTFSLAICTTCKYPERAMELIDYLYSYEGSRLINSGVQGREWDYVDGVPTLTEEGIYNWINGGDNSEIKVLVAYLSNFVGIKAGTVCPDGGYVNLYSDAAIYEKTMLSVDKAFSEKYGVSFPYEKTLNMVEEGKVSRASEYDSRICTATGAASEDIARIDVKLEDIAVTYIPTLVLADTDAEFAAQKAAMINELKANGYDTSVADWTTRFNAARSKYVQ